MIDISEGLNFKQEEVLELLAEEETDYKKNKIINNIKEIGRIRIIIYK